MELFVIAFEKDKMMLRVPTGKAKSVGMRRLSTPETIQAALKTLKGRPRAKRTMWSRRAQEYERSEEHTSELQSLMRTSYAVFCLKKKSQTNTHNNYTNM